MPPTDRATNDCPSRHCGRRIKRSVVLDLSILVKRRPIAGTFVRRLQRHTAIEQSTKAMAAGNIIFGGIIGAGVDVATGAAYDYPAVITNSLECKVG